MPELELLQECVELLKSNNNSVKGQILRFIDARNQAGEKTCVMDIVLHLNRTYYSVSQNLRMLRKGGWIYKKRGGRKEHKLRYYYLNEKTIKGVQDIIDAYVDNFKVETEFISEQDKPPSNAREIPPKFGHVQAEQYQWHEIPNLPVPDLKLPDEME